MPRLPGRANSAADAAAAAHHRGRTGEGACAYVARYVATQLL